MEGSSLQKAQPLAWMRRGIMTPCMIFIRKKNYDVDNSLRSVDLYSPIGDDDDGVIAMCRAFIMMRYLAGKEGMDVPLRIMADDDCFAPIRNILPPGSGTVESVLQSAVAAVPIHFSHFLTSAKIVGSGNLIITGEFEIPCHRNDLHLAQLYAIAAIQRIGDLRLPGSRLIFVRSVGLEARRRGRRGVRRPHRG